MNEDDRCARDFFAAAVLPACIPPNTVTHREVIADRERIEHIVKRRGRRRAGLPHRRPDARPLKAGAQAVRKYLSLAALSLAMVGRGTRRLKSYRQDRYPGQSSRFRLRAHTDTLSAAEISDHNARIQARRMARGKGRTR